MLPLQVDIDASLAEVEASIRWLLQAPQTGHGEPRVNADLSELDTFIEGSVSQLHNQARLATAALDALCVRQRGMTSDHRAASKLCACSSAIARMSWHCW
jgi:hypothetical protein